MRDKRFEINFLRDGYILEKVSVQQDVVIANNEQLSEWRDVQDGGNMDDLVEGVDVDNITIEEKCWKICWQGMSRVESMMMRWVFFYVSKLTGKLKCDCWAGGVKILIVFHLFLLMPAMCWRCMKFWLRARVALLWRVSWSFIGVTDLGMGL